MSQIQKPSNAFIAAYWIAMGIGMFGYLIGLWNAGMPLYEKGYYFTVLILGLFSVISLQKSVGDRLEQVPVTDIYYGLCWFDTILSLVLIAAVLYTASLQPSEKRFNVFPFILALYGVIAVQKNARDSQKSRVSDCPDL